MHTPNTPEQDPRSQQHGISPTGHGAPSAGYETSDVKVTGIVVFVASLAIFLVVFFVVCFLMGKAINTALIRHDGPPNRWNQYNFPAGKGKNLESNAALEQQQLRLVTTRFPTPQLQMDDGNQDVADMHAREDLLLDHYTWVDQQKGAVRIPIAHAMELIAQRGLPVAQDQAATGPLMTADAKPEATTPLTNGFARTGYEQQLEVEQSRQAQREHKETRSGEQARLAPIH
jgi:hypothetical protein